MILRRVIAHFHTPEWTTIAAANENLGLQLGESTAELEATITTHLEGRRR